MSLNRRQFLRTSGLALCMSALPQSVTAKEPSIALPIPPLLEPQKGRPLFLTMQQTQWAFSAGRKTSAWGFNGQYLGPTVRVQSGDDVKLIYSNRLSEPVAMTVSGLQVPGVLMGGAARMLSPGVEWSPILPVRQRAATCWYHANTPNRMANHIYQGLAGMWLIEDDHSRRLALPNHYGVDDFPLIIQDKRLSSFGEPEYAPAVKGGFLGNVLFTNGVQSPFVEVSRGWIRLRLLNASNSRHYVLQLSDGRPMQVIAGDLSLLPAPVAVQQLALAPGERREILIDMSHGEEVSLVAGKPANFLTRIRSFFEPTDVLFSTVVLTLRPTGLLPLMTETLPAPLLPELPKAGQPVRSREFRLAGPEAGINGSQWDMSRVDVFAQQGSWERWRIQAEYPQSFHIQGVSFLVSTINGVPPLAENRGWKDTVWVDGEVELYLYFSQPTELHFPFLFYSQTLELADHGSVAQLAVSTAAEG